MVTDDLTIAEGETSKGIVPIPREALKELMLGRTLQLYLTSDKGDRVSFFVKLEEPDPETVMLDAIDAAIETHGSAAADAVALLLAKEQEQEN